MNCILHRKYIADWIFVSNNAIIPKVACKSSYHIKYTYSPVPN